LRIGWSSFFRTELHISHPHRKSFFVQVWPLDVDLFLVSRVIFLVPKVGQRATIVNPRASCSLRSCFYVYYMVVFMALCRLIFHQLSNNVSHCLCKSISSYDFICLLSFPVHLLFIKNPPLCRFFRLDYSDTFKLNTESPCSTLSSTNLLVAFTSWHPLLKKIYDPCFKNHHVDGSRLCFFCFLPK